MDNKQKQEYFAMFSLISSGFNANSIRFFYAYCARPFDDKNQGGLYEKLF